MYVQVVCTAVTTNALQSELMICVPHTYVSSHTTCDKRPQHALSTRRNVQVCMATPLGLLGAAMVPRIAGVHAAPEGVQAVEQLIMTLMALGGGGAVVMACIMRAATSTLKASAQHALAQFEADAEHDTMQRTRSSSTSASGHLADDAGPLHISALASAAGDRPQPHSFATSSLQAPAYAHAPASTAPQIMLEDAGSEAGGSAFPPPGLAAAQNDTMLQQMGHMLRAPEFCATVATFGFTVSPLLLLVGLQDLISPDDGLASQLDGGLIVLAVGVARARPQACSTMPLPLALSKGARCTARQHTVSSSGRWWCQAPSCCCGLVRALSLVLMSQRAWASRRAE